LSSCVILVTTADGDASIVHIARIFPLTHKTQRDYGITLPRAGQMNTRPDAPNPTVTSAYVSHPAATEKKPILDETDLKRVIRDLEGQIG
jgi:hypothetical protein